ncbi:hypothetical protein IFR04_010675 [Cadophora malorum]|uniref:DNA-directed RNA polymerase I subunit RPA34.5 n=1 Tax=Cadophora malorum TaxID=108018 RepID=A0A8H7W3A9_9HELO|nr:hypothetical protein IFR04_010675 [Cadophora malorum]
MASTKIKSRDSGKKDKSVKTKKQTKKTPPPTTYKSEEFVQDSDEDEEKNGPAEDNSEESSDSDSSLSSAKPSKSSSKGKLPAPLGSSSSSEGEDEDEDNDESSEDEEDSQDATKQAPLSIEPTKKPSQQPTTNTVSLKAPTPYQPPPGFDLVSLNGTSRASQMLKKSSLEGKQIWYFTAPASVPISSVKTMSLLDAKNGKPILTHEGDDYGFMTDSAEDTTYTRILVPGSDAGYKATSKSIDHVFHLQQVARDPTAANPARATIPAKKPVRQQPRGLRMRFHPIGFGAAKPGTIGSSSSDEDTEDATPTTSRPVSKPKKFVRPDEDSDEEMEDSPPLPLRPHPENNASASSPDGASRKEKKRKHSEGGEKKSKHSSSSIMSNSYHRELKRLKKKQTESQRKLADNQSASIETDEATEPLPLRPKTPPRHPLSTTPVPPPKSLTFSQPLATNSGLHLPKSSSKKSKHTENHRSPSASGLLSIQDSTRAMDSKLTKEERREKKKAKQDAKRRKGGLE